MWHIYALLCFGRTSNEWKTCFVKITKTHKITQHISHILQSNVTIKALDGACIPSWYCVCICICECIFEPVCACARVCKRQKIQ